MANKRNNEWPLASVFDGFFTQDKSGGVTERVSPALVVSAVQAAGVFQPLGADLTAIEALSTSGYLRRTGTNTWTLDSAATPASHAASHLFGGSDAISGQSLPGLRTSDSPEFLRVYIGSDLRMKDTTTGIQAWGLTSSSSGLELAARNSDWSAIDWPLTIQHQAGGVIRLGGTTSRPVNLTGSLQLGGVDTITATREGRFTGLRLTNLSAGQIPVASDANGQITASGLTDDGTFLGISRIIRAWNSIARSGSTWTALQWTQDAQERVSIFSSNGSGAGAYHNVTLVPADTEATERVLGVIQYAQKVSGKSGVNPGLKAAILADSVGAGGTVGGFGGKLRIRYRPDNGNDLVDALRIGAFGGGTADAVETAILLRAKASIEANFATIQDNAHLAPGLDILGTSNQGHIRILNNASASILGGGIGDVEISGSKRVLIGNPGGGALLIGANFTGINYPRFAGNTNWESSNRTGAASTADSETIVVYTGESNATESLPVASGSKRIIVFAHASNSGNWTLDADGTDMIAGELQANVGSITILPNSAVKQRRLIDHAFGLWVVI